MEQTVVSAPPETVKTSEWTWTSTFKAIGLFAVGIAIGIGAAIVCSGGDESASE